MALLVFAEDHQVGYDGYKSRLRTTRVALLATGLSCGQAERCSSSRGRISTTMLAFCGFLGRLKPHMVL